MSPVRVQPKALGPWGETPVEVFARLNERRGAVFFDSASSHGRGRISLLAAEPEDELQGGLDDADQLQRWLRENEVADVPGIEFPLGGAFGCVSYEGRFHFGLYRNLLIYRHDTGDWLEVGRARHWLRERPWRVPRGPREPLRFFADTDRARFEEAVRRAQESIAAGDIYQVNLAQRFVADWPAGARPWDFYEALRSVSPAPYAAFLRFGGRVLLSSSPELFLRFRGQRVETRPIKGTRPRYGDPRRDERSARELLASEKERSELVMITDLERNDLGRFCEFGSVGVADLARLERFEQVYHLVSTVRGTMRRDVDSLEALRLSFPGGSITGAPKRRAREIIRELEGRPRGIYTGAIGYFGLNGQSQFSIAIRTAEVAWNRLEFRVGAGIVADSDPRAEYEETLHKAAGMFRAAEMWSGSEERFALAGDFRRLETDDGFRAPVLRRFS